MVQAFGHVNLGVSDLEKMVGFYTKVLGFKDVFRLTDADGNMFGAYIMLPDGNFLEFIQRKNVSENVVPAFNAGHLCFEVDDINKQKEIIDANGIEIIFKGVIQGRDKNWQFFINDPENNKIEFMQMDPESPQRISQAALKNS